MLSLLRLEHQRKKISFFLIHLVLTRQNTFIHSRSFLQTLVCYTAVFSVVTQCSWEEEEWGGALRDDTKNGCVADYLNSYLIPDQKGQSLYPYQFRPKWRKERYPLERLMPNLVPRSPTAKGKGVKQSEIWVRD